MISQHHQEMMRSIGMSKTKSLLIILFLSGALWAQEDKVSFSNWIRSYPKYLVTGFRQTISDKSNQVILGSATASILLFLNYDQSVRQYSQDKGLLPENMARMLDYYGGGAAYPLALFGVGVTSHVEGLSGKECFRKLEYVVTSFEVTAIVTSVMKWVVGRERPNKQSTTSFPSGHTSGSFVVAATLDELYGHRVGIPVYITAGMVGIERIHDNKHWLTDVIAGAAVGTVIGRGFGVVYRDKSSESKAAIVPLLGRRQARLLISYSLD